MRMSTKLYPYLTFFRRRFGKRERERKKMLSSIQPFWVASGTVRSAPGPTFDHIFKNVNQKNKRNKQTHTVLRRSLKECCHESVGPQSKLVLYCAVIVHSEPLGHDLAKGGLLCQLRHSCLIGSLKET